MNINLWVGITVIGGAASLGLVGMLWGALKKCKGPDERAFVFRAMFGFWLWCCTGVVFFSLLCPSPWRWIVALLLVAGPASGLERRRKQIRMRESSSTEQ